MDNATTFEQITETEFFERFKPVQNTITNGQSSYDGCMFETYGDEYAAVVAAHLKNPAQVWTVLEGDDGELFIGDGMHFVNRLGYIITEVPAPEGVSFEIYDPEDLEEIKRARDEFEQCAQRPAI